MTTADDDDDDWCFCLSILHVGGGAKEGEICDVKMPSPLLYTCRHFIWLSPN